jgi:hypothetical protein
MVGSGHAVLIRPGVRHRAIGRMSILKVVVPPFDPAGEWFDCAGVGRNPTLRSGPTRGGTAGQEVMIRREGTARRPASIDNGPMIVEKNPPGL